MKTERPSTIAAAKVNTTFQRIPIPFGLLIALGVYAVAVGFYIWATFYNSPEYQAAEHWYEGLQLLGVDDGRSCTQQELERAFTHLLEVGRLEPDQGGVQERIESVRWRFDERHFKLPLDLKMRSESVAMAHQNLKQQRAPILVVGLRNRGWGPEQLLKGPRTAVLWSIPGAVVICLVWVWWRFGPNRIKAQEHEAELLKAEAEVKELGAFRRVHPDAPGPKKRPPTGGTKGPR